MVRKISPYYICQLAGWGMVMLGMLLLAYGWARVLEIEVLAGLVSSHLLRMVIIRAGWLEGYLVRSWRRVAVAVLLTCMIASGIKLGCCAWLIGWPGGQFLPGVFEYFLLLLPWTGIYFFYHEIQRSRQQCVRAGELKQRIDVMQQQCEESGTDMEGMMVKLQRIASLIEADPDRSREEITEFSKLLRSGYMR